MVDWKGRFDDKGERLRSCGMRVEVTQEHIERSKRRSSTRCPIALALTEAFGTERPVPVGLVTNVVGEDDRKEKVLTGAGYWYMGRFVALSWEAAMFAWEFDQGVEVEPFGFEVEL